MHCNTAQPQPGPRTPSGRQGARAQADSSGRQGMGAGPGRDAGWGGGGGKRRRRSRVLAGARPDAFSVPGKLRQEDVDIKASLGYLVRLNKNKEKKKKKKAGAAFVGWRNSSSGKCLSHKPGVLSLSPRTLTKRCSAIPTRGAEAGGWPRFSKRSCVRARTRGGDSPCCPGLCLPRGERPRGRSVAPGS